MRLFPANSTLIDIIHGSQRILGNVKKVTAKYTFTLELRRSDPNYKLRNKKLDGGVSY